VTGLSPRQVSYETWLNHLPPNQVLRFKDIFEIRKRPNGSSSPQVLSLTNKGIIERDISNNEGQLAESYDNYQVVEIGDFVLNPMDLLSGWVARSSFDGVISNAYFVFRLRSGSRPISSNPVFYELLLQSYYKNGILEPFGKGVGRPENGGGRWTLNSETLSTIPFPSFPLVRQDAIVEFLDRELAQIDHLITKELRLVDVLSDFWFASIRFAVTGGLQSQVPKKPSRLAWLGEIPEDWEISKISRSWQITSGKMLNQSAEQVGIALPYLTTASIQDDGLNLNEPNEMHFSPAEVANYSLAKGDVLVVEGGAIGKSAVLESDLVGWGYQNHVLRLRPKDFSNARFLDYYLKHLRAIGHFDSLSAFATIPNLSASKLGAVEWPVVPDTDADSIVKHLDNLRQSISRLTKDAIHMVNLLQERRTALISNAITGKLQLWED
jgi:type I restriction enzyme S subunit